MSGPNLTRAVDPAGDAAFLKTLTACRLCEGRMDSDQDDKRNGLCWSCKDRPEARRLKATPIQAARPVPPTSPTPPGPRPARLRPEFSAADKSLIQRLGPILPVGDLLRLLNERLEANQPDALPFTLEQLQAALPTTVTTNDWAAVRKLLTHARASGLLGTITPQVID